MPQEVKHQTPVMFNKYSQIFTEKTSQKQKVECRNTDKRQEQWHPIWPAIVNKMTEYSRRLPVWQKNPINFLHQPITTADADGTSLIHFRLNFWKNPGFDHRVFVDASAGDDMSWRDCRRNQKHLSNASLQCSQGHTPHQKMSIKMQKISKLSLSAV